MLSDYGYDLLYDYKQGYDIDQLEAFELREFKRWIIESIKLERKDRDNEKLKPGWRNDAKENIANLKCDIKLINAELNKWKQVDKLQLKLNLRRNKHGQDQTDNIQTHKQAGR